MEKYDAKKVMPLLYNVRRAEPYMTEYPEHWELSAGGIGSPRGSEFVDTMSVLYGIAYAYKFMSKGEGKDFTVSPPEASWGMANDAEEFDREHPEKWKWRLIIPLPFWTSGDSVEHAKEEWARKKKTAAPDSLNCQAVGARSIVRMLHIGPYSECAPYYDQLLQYANDNDLCCGEAHEIYISNPSRVAPEKIKTILFFPIKDS